MKIRCGQCGYEFLRFIPGNGLGKILTVQCTRCKTIQYVPNNDKVFQCVNYGSMAMEAIIDDSE